MVIRVTRHAAAVATGLFALLAGQAGPAMAGDFATLNILGFSPDGSVFAFEQYGVQDGSGFPYAERFYIDTDSDSFLTGTPIRVRIEDEQADIAAARAQAREAAQAIVSDEILAAHRGFLAGFNAPGEHSADPWRIMVNPRPVEPPVDEPLEIRLQEKVFAAGDNCPEDIEKGFTLTLVDVAPGGTTRLLADDASVPASRGCPNGYRIGGVQTFYPQSGTPVFATLITVRSFGFEGPDYRWMAVTAPIGGASAN